MGMNGTTYVVPQVNNDLFAFTIPQSTSLTAPVLPPLMRSIKGGGPR